VASAAMRMPTKINQNRLLIPTPHSLSIHFVFYDAALSSTSFL